MTDKKGIFHGVNVLLGVSGSVAVYKAVDLASRLTKQGATVRTILTECGRRFVQPVSFTSITGQEAYTTMWLDSGQFKTGHIDLSDWCDVLIVAPATANIIAKAAVGICDDLLSTTLCACWEKPILFAPAMNTKMWINPLVRSNVQKLGEMGCTIVGPAAGRLACGTTGPGRMSEPEDIIEKLEELIEK